MNHDRFRRGGVGRSALADAIVIGLACLAVVLLGGQTIVGAGEIGLGVDDYVHALRTDAWLKFGWYVPEYTFAGGEPDPNRGNTSPYIYGAAFSAMAHLVNVALGNERMGEVQLTADAYAIRHLLVALIGLIAVLAVGTAVRVLTRDWVATVWSCAALLAIPVWTGYAMFSIKDIPVATAFTVVTVALVVGLSWIRENTWPSARRGVVLGLIVAGSVFLGVGVRPAMWVPFSASLATFGLLAWAILRSIRGAARSLAAPAIGFFAGVAGAAALHPRTSHDPIGWLINAVSDSSDAAREGITTLTAGELLSEVPPIWYLPAWLLAALPVLIMLVAAVGVVIVARKLLQVRQKPAARRGPSLGVTGGMVLVTLQLVLLPLAAIVTGSASSTGLRQHLYVLPPVAILAGIGAAGLRSWLATRESSHPKVWIPAAIMCLAIAIPAVEQTRLYPYNYVYVSEPAGIGGVGDRWETEYQFISAREAFHQVPDGVAPKCSPWMVLPTGGKPSQLIQDCYAPLPPYYEELGLDPASHPWPDKLWVIGRRRSGNRPPGFCEERDNVTRPLRGEDIVMAYVLRCDPPFRPQRDRDRTEASASTTAGSSSVPARARSADSASGPPPARARASSQAARTTLEASGIRSPASSRDPPPS